MLSVIAQIILIGSLSGNSGAHGAQLCSSRGFAPKCNPALFHLQVASLTFFELTQKAFCACIPRDFMIYHGTKRCAECNNLKGRNARANYTLLQEERGKQVVGLPKF